MESVKVAITTLRDELEQQREQIQHLHANTARPKPTLPHPEKFNGQSYRWDTWLPSIRAKLRVDGPAIGDDVAQFYYVYLNLESQVQAMVLPQLSHAEETRIWNYSTILEQLARVYDNPNKVQEAEDRLFTLKQGSDSLPAYIAKFERVLHEARGQTWHDVNKISLFRNGLSPTIRNRLAQQLELPRTYQEFLRVVQQLASRSGAPSQPSQPFASRPHAPSISRPLQHAPEPMDVSSMNQIYAFEETALAPAPAARSMSPTLREQYRLQGRCVRCGSYSHWVKDCIVKPFQEGSQELTVFRGGG